MGDLIERLREGCVLRPKRWSGDTHDDLGGSIDESATDDLLREAAAALEAAREDAERYRWMRDSPERPCRVPCAYAVMPGDVEYPTPLGGETLDAAIDQARGKGVAGRVA